MTSISYNRKGHVLSIGKNSYKKSHPIQAHFAKLEGLDDKIFLHAEIDAILRAGIAKIHTIEVFRNNKKGEPVISKPCIICVRALKAYGVQTVRYHDADGIKTTVAVNTL